MKIDSRKNILFTSDWPTRNFTLATLLPEITVVFLMLPVHTMFVYVWSEASSTCLSVAISEDGLDLFASEMC